MIDSRFNLNLFYSLFNNDFYLLIYIVEINLNSIFFGFD